MKSRSRRRRMRPRLHLDGTRTARPTASYRLQGIAAALATVAREHRGADFAMMVLSDMDLSLEDLKAAGADPYYDLEPLEAASHDFRR
jgi:hypothetical protein